MPSDPVVSSNIDQALTLLQQGLLVAIPTETVYGLGADASNEAALERLYTVKGRPTHHPVIVHLAHVQQLSQWAIDIPDSAYQLAEAFWPGPMTLILKKAPHVSSRITGGQDTIGLRIPNHPLTLALLEQFQGGIAAPSANKFGCLSPTTPEQVCHALGNAIPMILDGGPCHVGIESTIIDLSGGTPCILRPGMLTEAEIHRVLTAQVTALASSILPRSDVRAPGTLNSHYAPRSPVELVTLENLPARIASLASDKGPLGILSRQPKPMDNPNIHWVQAPKDAPGYAKQLYANLFYLDQLGCRTILVEVVPTEGSWTGVADRLGRAASGSSARTHQPA